MLLAEIHATAFGPEEAWNAAIMAGYLAMPASFALLAGAEAMIMARVAADEAEILTLAVAPQARRRGLARALLTEAAQACVALGAATLFLEVASGNAAARALYAGAGFAEVGLRRGYYEGGGDAVVMAKALGEGGG